MPVITEDIEDVKQMLRMADAGLYEGVATAIRRICDRRVKELLGKDSLPISG
jgi:hypothetical protein